MAKFHYKISEIVYFMIDESNEPFVVVGLIDRGDCERYLISNKEGEKEVTFFEITNENIIR